MVKKSLGEISLERRLNDLETVTAEKLQQLQEELTAAKHDLQKTNAALHQLQQEQEITKRQLAKINITGINYSSECISPT